MIQTDQMPEIPKKRTLNRILFALPLAAFTLAVGTIAVATVFAEGGGPPSWWEPKSVTLTKTTTGAVSTTVGSTYSYTLEIVNRSQVTATVGLTDVLPSETELVGAPTVTVISPTASLSSTALATRTLSWAGTVGVGAKVDITFDVKLDSCPLRQPFDDGELNGVVNAALLVVNNRAVSVASASFRPASCKPNSTPQPTPTLVPTTTASADIAMRAFGRLHPDWDAPDRGWRASWLDFYANLGSQTATSATLVDTLSTNQTLDRILSAPSLTPTTTTAGIQFPIGDLPSLKGGAVLLRASVPFSTPTGTMISNTATVSASNDGKASNNTTTVSLTLPALPPLITYPRSGLTFTGTMTVTGKAQTGSTVSIYIDREFVTATVASTAGDWSIPAQLADGVHSIYAVNGNKPSALSASDDDWRVWKRSNVVIFKIDSTLVWDPMSLTFTAADGTMSFLHGGDGWHDRDDWYVSLQPTTTYTVSVRVCCTSSTMTLTVPSAGNVPMSDPSNSLTFSGNFATGSASALVSGTLKLCAQANGTTQCDTGRVVPHFRHADRVVIITPDGFDPPRLNVSQGEIIEIVNLSDDARDVDNKPGSADAMGVQSASASNSVVRLEVGESYTVQASATQSLYNTANNGQSVTITAGPGSNFVYLPLLRKS